MSDGVLLATLALTDSGRTYGTVNTPGANGDRLYVSTQLLAADGSADPSAQGRLYAIDVNAGDPDPGRRLRVAWFFPFRGPSGASPLVIVKGGVPTVFFDGQGLAGAPTDTPLFFGLRDSGAVPAAPLTGDWRSSRC